ncbi:hypothetical protein [Streptomyces sp. NPDC050504]|uniref:hypothetical protein n=1 Tax=Streptomyces sp. NPDC050504 TaxID=3365618 RepID=UPI00378E2B76
MTEPSDQPSPRCDGNAIVILDQRALPHEQRLPRLDTVADATPAAPITAVASEHGVHHPSEVRA